MKHLRAFLMIPVMAVVVLPVAVIEGDWSAAGVLALAGAIGAVTGLVGPRFGSDNDDEDRSTAGLMADVAVAWTLLALAAAMVTLALALSAQDEPFLADPVSAIFEAVSGVTTTGLTMVATPETLSPTMQWWRSVMQWAGALGVVVFALTIAESSGDRDDFMQAGWGDKPAEKPRRAAGLIGLLATGLAAVSVVGLWLAGDPPWRALNHGVTAAATGGFTITGDSATASTPAARVVLAVVITLSAVSFGTLWGALTGNGPPLWRRTQLRWGLGTFVLLAGLSVLAAEGGAPTGGVLFNAASAASTAGFFVGDAHQRIPAVALIAITSMFIGGAAGSTAGGVKVSRIAWLAKAAVRWLPQGHDVYEKPYCWDGEDIDVETASLRVTGASALLGVWLVTAVVVTGGLMLMTPATLNQGLFEAVSAMGGVGLSSGLTEADLASGPKLWLSLAMLVGRVEITAFIALAYRACRVND